MKYSFVEESYRTPRKKSIGEHCSTLPDERYTGDQSSLKKNSIYKYSESPNSSASKKKPAISPLKTTSRVVTYKNDKGQLQKSKSGENEDFRNYVLQQHQISTSPQRSWNPVLSEQKNIKAKFSPVLSSARNELRETANFRQQDLREQTETEPEEELQNCPVPEPNLHTPIRESHETPNQSTRRSRKDRKKIKEEKSQTPSITSDAIDYQSEKEPASSVKAPLEILEVSPIKKSSLSNNNQQQESKTKERRSRKERAKNGKSIVF